LCAALAATVMAQVEHLRYEVLSDFVAALKRNMSQSQATVLSNVLAVSVARPARLPCC
jgi:butyrate kinase